MLPGEGGLFVHQALLDVPGFRCGDVVVAPESVLLGAADQGDVGVRLAALTQSAQPVLDAQLRAAGLAGLLDPALSADDVGRLKPAREAYAYAAQRLGVGLGDLTLVAAHAWDIAGARAAGARTAFVARPGKALDPLAPPPDLVVADLGELADELLARPDHDIC